MAQGNIENGKIFNQIGAKKRGGNTQTNKQKLYSFIRQKNTMTLVFFISFLFVFYAKPQ